MQDAQLLILGTYRDTEVVSGHPLAEVLGILARESQRLDLQGLTMPEVTQLVTDRGLSLSETNLSTLHKATEGNPFFVSEVLQLLGRDGELSLVPFPISQGIRETLRHRLARLSEGCRQLLAHAAVIGREFDLDLLSQSYTTSSSIQQLQILSLLQDALTARLISVAPDNPRAYRFVHALVRETLYEDLSLSERVRSHRQIGEAIEQRYAAYLRPHLTELADHFFQAAAGEQSAKALHYAVQAGERADALFAYEEASTLYERSLQLPPFTSEKEAQRCELLLALGNVLAKAGEAKKARATYHQAAAIARALRTREETGSAASLLARAALGFAGRSDVATHFDQPMVDLLEEALGALAEENISLRVMVLSRLAMALYFSPFVERRDHLSQQAVEMARRLGETATLASALSARHIALLGPDTVRGRLPLALEIIQLGSESGKKETVLAGHLYCLMDFLELGDLVAVQRALQAHGQIAEELRQPFYLWHTTILRGTLALLTGRFVEAEQLLQEALIIGQRAQTPNALLIFAAQLFRLRWAQGQLQEIEETAKSFVERYPAIPASRAGLAFLYCEQNQLDAARHEFEQCATNEFAAFPRDQQWLQGMLLFAHVAASLRDTYRAELLYRLLSPYANRIAVSGTANDCSGPVSHDLGLLSTTLTRWDDAVQHVENALAMSVRLGARPFVAHTQCEYARMLLLRGQTEDEEKALRLLEQALFTAQQLGMKKEEKVKGQNAKVKSQRPEQEKSRQCPVASRDKEARDWRLETSPLAPQASSLKFLPP